MPKVIEDEDVYQAVIEVVAEYGYSGATTKQMADAADVSEVTLFRKYGNKAQSGEGSDCLHSWNRRNLPPRWVTPES